MFDGVTRFVRDGEVALNGPILNKQCDNQVLIVVWYVLEIDFQAMLEFVSWLSISVDGMGIAAVYIGFGFYWKLL